LNERSVSFVLIHSHFHNTGPKSIFSLWGTSRMGSFWHCCNTGVNKGVYTLTEQKRGHL